MQFRNLSLCAVVLVCAYISATAQDTCRDNAETFLLNKKEKTCSQVTARCNSNKVKENCPVMCCQCNRTGKFKITEINGKKNCGWVLKAKTQRCNYAAPKKNCPLHCNEPGKCPVQAKHDVTPKPMKNNCEDKLGKFTLANGNQKSCWHANKNQNLCNDKIIFNSCGKTCNPDCDNPSTLPAVPTMCDLTIELSFSTKKKDIKSGYHTNQMSIHSTLGSPNNQVCTYGKSTSWGQFHSTEWKAYIEVDKDLVVTDYDFQESFIPNAKGSKTRVNVNTSYDTGDTKPHQTSNLYALVNTGTGKERIGLFQMNPTDTSTHHSYGVDITCSNQCHCTATKVTPKCKVRAELGFDPANIAKRTKKNNGGYHACYLDAIREGTREWCGTENTATTWNCQQDGDAWFDTTKGNNINEVSYTHMSDMANTKVTFFHNHWYTGVESEQKRDERVASQLKIYVNDQLKFTTVHDIKKDSGGFWNTHYKDGSINPNYPGSYTQKLSCNQNCACTLTPKKNIKCRLHARLTYPEFDGPFAKYGIREDQFSATKKNAGGICSSSITSGKTWWDCFHSGPENSHSVNWKDDNYIDYKATEKINIIKAAGGEFLFNRTHIPTGNYYYIDDANNDMIPDLKIYANDVEIIPTAGVNLDAQDLLATVTCSDACQCTWI